MKKLLLSFSMLCLTLLTFGQTTNTIPTVGKVGIGTTTPSAKLDVNGNAIIDSTLTVKDSIIIQKEAKVEENLTVKGQIIAPNIEQAPHSQGNQFILIDPITGQMKKGDANEVGNYLGEIIYSKQCGPDPNADVPAPVWNNGLNKIYMDCPPVQVGIGNNTPRTKLDVTGGIYGNNIMIGQHPSNAEGRLHVHSLLPDASTDNVMIVQNNERRIFQLDNTGLLRTREVKVDAQAWPDYVFEKGYDLMSLEEIEAFIQKEGHLPNVPSAEQVEKEGQDLGEMNKILLQKVEELTLHLIEQQKQIDELKEQLQDK